ncbi:uncharacterized protein LOC134819964 [Bolinopsis microptera]|uniref:uncharacterized protein LOC134819964 n=1 Tax=Bolinopsis microptera TaxID=2820187 RepID=UPI00307AB703
MVNCAVQWCKNSSKGKSTSKLEGRTFLRFHTLPKNSAMSKKWKVRMGRRPKDITATMAVCSDHFNDSDYKDILRTQLMSYKGMQIILKANAVPNTDQDTGEMRSQADSPCVTGRSRKRVRRDATSVDAFIAEQEAILGIDQTSAAPDVVDDQLPGPDVVDDQLPGPDVEDDQLPGPDVVDDQLPGPDVVDDQLPGPDVVDDQLPGPDVEDDQLPGPDAVDDQLPGPDVVDDQLPGPGPDADEPDQPVPHICICNTQRRAASTQTELSYPELRPECGYYSDDDDKDGELGCR